jgi:hypothetical protein
MALQHDAVERRASARASVRNHLKCIGHSLEFRSEERLGLVSGRICCWIKQAFDCLTLCNARRKVERELDVELHGTDDDRKLMAQRNAWREASRMAEIDRLVSRVRKAVQEASANRCLGWQKLTVRYREFARRFIRHRSIGLVSE